MNMNASKKTWIYIWTTVQRLKDERLGIERPLVDKMSSTPLV